MTSRGDWVRVEGELELRAGMTVEVRPCRCGNRERIVLLSRSPHVCRDHDCDAWKWAGKACHAWLDTCLLSAIREGRLYRLVLPPEATDDAEAVTRERELIK